MVANLSPSSIHYPSHGISQKLSKIDPLLLWNTVQGDHLSGKPGNIREFDSCQGNVTILLKVREKLPKTVYCKLHICVHTGI